MEDSWISNNIDRQETMAMRSFLKYFCCATVLSTDGAEEDIKARLGNEEGAFFSLRIIWRRSQLNKDTKQ